VPLRAAFFTIVPTFPAMVFTATVAPAATYLAPAAETATSSIESSFFAESVTWFVPSPNWASSTTTSVSPAVSLM